METVPGIPPKDTILERGEYLFLKKCPLFPVVLWWKTLFQKIFYTHELRHKRYHHHHHHHHHHTIHRHPWISGDHGSALGLEHRLLWLCRPMRDGQILPQVVQVKGLLDEGGGWWFFRRVRFSSAVCRCLSSDLAKPVWCSCLHLPLSAAKSSDVLTSISSDLRSLLQADGQELNQLLFE